MEEVAGADAIRAVTPGVQEGDEVVVLVTAADDATLQQSVAVVQDLLGQGLKGWFAGSSSVHSLAALEQRVAHDAQRHAVSQPQQSLHAVRSRTIHGSGGSFFHIEGPGVVASRPAVDDPSVAVVAALSIPSDTGLPHTNDSNPSSSSSSSSSSAVSSGSTSGVAASAFVVASVPREYVGAGTDESGVPLPAASNAPLAHVFYVPASGQLRILQRSLLQVL